MREIKFRAWHKGQKRWVYGILVGLDGVAERYIDDDGGKSGLWEHECNESDQLQLVQYTGLKDKNGKEIYEGDVIRDCNGLPDTWVVEWSVEEAGFLGLDWCGKPNEVIGNIYEHPGLIKEDK